MREPIFEFVARDPLSFAVSWTGALGRKSPDIPSAGAVGIDIDPFAIRRVVGTIVRYGARRKPLFTPAFNWSPKDIEVVAALADEGQPLPVRRPSVEIAGTIRREQSGFRAVGRSDKHLRVRRRAELRRKG